MERQVGEVFDFDGIKLQVKDTGHDASCNGFRYHNSLASYWVKR